MERSSFSIDYGASRPLDFQPYVIDSYEKEDLFDRIVSFVNCEMNIQTYKTMDAVKACKLIERIAIMFCKSEAPTQSYGVKKAEIRDAILQALDILDAGPPPWERVTE